jgi:GNAT superfamily N-acetyltransferase
MLFIDQSVAARLEDTQAWRGVYYTAAQQRLRPATPSRSLAVGSVQVRYAGPASPVNRAIGLGMHAPATAADLVHIAQFYQSYSEPARIDLCPLADPTVPVLLRQHHYHVESFLNVLVHPLPWRMDVPPPRADIVVTVADAQHADQWIETVAHGFTGHTPPPPDSVAVLAPNFYSANAQCFFAWIAGQPVAGGAMYRHYDVVELGGTSTRPAWRGRGVHTALVEHRLQLATAAGCSMAIVVTSPGTPSQRNLERLGFQLAYTKAILVQD